MTTVFNLLQQCTGAAYIRNVSLSLTFHFIFQGATYVLQKFGAVASVSLRIEKFTRTFAELTLHKGKESNHERNGCVGGQKKKKC